MNPRCSSTRVVHGPTLNACLLCKSAREQLYSWHTRRMLQWLHMLPSLIVLLVHAKPHQGCTHLLLFTPLLPRVALIAGAL